MMAKEKSVDLTVGDALPIGSRIRLRRQAQAVRLSRMARDLGYDKGYLSNVENNRASPSDEFLSKIVDYLDISVLALRKSPISIIAGHHPIGQEASSQPFGLVHPALPVPVFAPQKKTIGQRIERLIVMAHLSEEEQEILEEHLVRETSAEIGLLKRLRRSKEG